ncbi:MAG: Co2+/Mg2+ efflux protein ApaG [Pseudomonadota bacterium]
MIYEATTDGVRVRVQPDFLEDNSQPEEGAFVWSYAIEIANVSDRRVQLLKRTWDIVDAQGNQQRVHGDGVVGEQPVLEPGEAFAYKSGVPLATASGFMRGLFHMIDEQGAPFDIEVPAFSLDSPFAAGAMH